jgi:hypothetical protein
MSLESASVCLQGGDQREHNHAEKVDALVFRREGEYDHSKMFKNVAHRAAL